MPTHALFSASVWSSAHLLTSKLEQAPEKALEPIGDRLPTCAASISGTSSVSSSVAVRGSEVAVCGAMWQRGGAMWQ